MIMTGEMESTGGNTCPTATLPIVALTGTGTGPNPGLRGERPTTNILSYGTTFKDHNQPKLI